ncbi:MAG: hypothetical protein J1E57_08820 [Prevotella sp.]|nr:hypothetical protein [Prevotella sp.]
MKKFFTFVSMALVAMSVNAQTELEKWDASEKLTFATQNFEGVGDRDVLQEMKKSDNQNKFKKVPTIYENDPLPDANDQDARAKIIADATEDLQLDDYIFTGETTNVTLTGVCTPNPNELSYNYWMKEGNDNQFLNEENLGAGEYTIGENTITFDKSECLVSFGGKYVKAQHGNPSITAYQYYFINDDKKEVGPRYVEDYYTKDCGELPKKGAYFKFNVKSAGKLIIGFFLNNNLNANPLFIVDGDTKAPLAQDEISILAFRNNRNYEVEKGRTTRMHAYTLDENYLIQDESGIMGADTNRKLYGYISFNTEAGKDYYMFSPKSQMGLYGFEFTPTGGADGITEIATTTSDNAPVYNLAGQRVSNDTKGLLIKNGKKFINK